MPCTSHQIRYPTRKRHEQDRFNREARQRIDVHCLANHAIEREGAADHEREPWRVARNEGEVCNPRGGESHGHPLRAIQTL